MTLNWKQKIILSILREIKKISRLKLFKLAFLLSRQTEFYDFVPYKFGPYSFDMDKDLRTLQKNEIIDIDNQIILFNDINHRSSLDYETNNKLLQIAEFYYWEERDIINYIYENYPYYTQNSRIRRIEYKREEPPISIYSIGYQGLSIDTFLNTLINKGIRRVIDVRNKPLSYKYGFNIYWLRKYLPEFGIKYVNIPELGIEESIRRSRSKTNLWEFYIKNLDKKGEFIQKASDMITSEPSVLMCFEINPDDCHRYQLSKTLRQKLDLPIIDYNKGFGDWKKLN